MNVNEIRINASNYILNKETQGAKTKMFIQLAIDPVNLFPLFILCKKSSSNCKHVQLNVVFNSLFFLCFFVW